MSQFNIGDRCLVVGPPPEDKAKSCWIEYFHNFIGEAVEICEAPNAYNQYMVRVISKGHEPWYMDGESLVLFATKRAYTAMVLNVPATTR